MRRRNPQWGKILLVSAIALGGISIANAHDDDKHDDEKSGDRITRTFDFSGFDEIDISGVYDVEVEVGESFSVRVEGREREMEYADIRVEGDTLILGQKKKKWSWRNRKDIDAYVTMPALAALDVSGVTDAEIEGVDSDDFELSVSGVADVNISGRCGTIDASVSGVSDVNAKDLKCASGDVSLSGVGDMDVYTSDAIDVSVHGVGDVTVWGSPEEVEKSVSKYTASLTIK